MFPVESVHTHGDRSPNQEVEPGETSFLRKSEKERTSEKEREKESLETSAFGFLNRQESQPIQIG